jgi:hypothetical protein
MAQADHLAMTAEEVRASGQSESRRSPRRTDDVCRNLFNAFTRSCAARA